MASDKEHKQARYRPAKGSTELARALRTDPTNAEKAMWRILRAAFPDARFRRQVPIRRFIVDFASHHARLAIECDGGRHGGSGDVERTRMIEAEGYRVLRFWNDEILGNLDGVRSTIERVLHERHPHPASPIKGEG